MRERVPWLNRWDANLVLKKGTSLPECRVKSLQSRWALASAVGVSRAEAGRRVTARWFAVGMTRWYGGRAIFRASGV